MSRCFPFPPPGYESKPRPDNVNLIIEEKQKQKKHKHKKDKDKKDRSERKEKERSEGKHKEDKKRKRKKDKKKDKQSSSVEKRIVGSLENQNGVPDSKSSDGIQDQRTSSELGKRVGNDGGTGNQMVQKIALVEKTKANNLPVKMHENSNDIKDNREHITMANGHGLGDDASSLGNGAIGYCNGEIKIKVEGTYFQVEKVEKRNEAKEKNVSGEGDGSKNKKRDKNTKAEDKRRKEKKKKKMSKEKKIKQETTDVIFQDLRPNNHSDVVNESRECHGKLPKLKELNGFLHANGIRPNKTSRSAFPSHQADHYDSSFLRPSQNIINLAVENVAVATNQKVNGNGNGKLSSPKPVIKIVRKTEPCQTANNSVAKHVSFSINNHGLRNGLTSPHLVHIEKKTEPCQTNNGPDEKIPPLENGGKKSMQRPNALHKTDKKESTKNGTLEGEKHTSSRSSKAKEKKPPHPDLKYLSQILTVPQVEWPQCDDDDDQEWLFGCKKTKRPKWTSSQIHEQVWSEAMQLDSADVIAMPYVIPY